MSQHSVLFYKKIEEYYSDKKTKPWTAAELKENAAEILSAKQTPGKKTRRQYYLLSLYDVQKIADKQILTKKPKDGEQNPITIVSYEDLFNVLSETHVRVGHGGRDKMIHALQTKYDIPRCAVEKFLETCEVCQKKKNKSHVNLTIKPIILRHLNARGQVDLVDFQSCADNDYKWLLSYQDHLTKFVFLRPLKTKTAGEVAAELLKIFLEVGAPSILQSDHSREFTNLVIFELVNMWPMLKIVYGHTRRPQSQGSVERSNQDVENMLRAWMHDHNSTNWSLGCSFVQFQKNCSYHEIIGCTPYKAFLGVDPKVGLSSENFPGKLLHQIEDEDDLTRLLEMPEENVQDSNKIIEFPQQSEDEGELLTAEDQAAEKIIESYVNNFDIVCRGETSTGVNKSDGNQGQKRAAEKILPNKAKKLPRLEIGSCVLLPVDEIDRGPSGMQNLVCVVTDYQNGVYQVGCSAGRIKSWFDRTDLIQADEQFLTMDNVPQSFFSKREAVQALIFTGGQGCSCKPSKKQCLTSRCACFKKKVLCSSRCHSSVTCANE